MKYCWKCRKEVKPKNDYSGYLYLIGFIVLIVADLAFHIGAWAFVVALIVARILAPIFKTKRCPACHSDLNRPPKSLKDNGTLKSVTDKGNHLASKISENISAQNIKRPLASPQAKVLDMPLVEGNFVAIDVETANADMASICQIGIARYSNGLLLEEWKSYIDPEDYFDSINVSIHGIDKSIVKGSPTFPALIDTLYSFLDNTVVVCHTHFDRVALHQAAERYDTCMPAITWLDSARVARRTWNEFAWKGYGLYNVCKALGYDFKHHDALEDAKAAAHILLASMNETGLDLEGWLRRVKQPINPAASCSGSAIRHDGNPEGPFYGEILVFTGALEVPRREAADLAASVGFQVALGVTEKTTLLIVGDQDIKKLAGHEKSSKHRKAEKLIEKGFPIRILKESDFKELVRLSTKID